ncbi:MAG: hypothetical protein KC505_10535 [Myxococcales bacterium]|nr:hypothetical protein [Myxococcales bacterium]USN51308.1 MAG: hypothetical protein H6731_02570 [Myxococcales bacterium]
MKYCLVVALVCYFFTSNAQGEQQLQLEQAAWYADQLSVQGFDFGQQNIKPDGKIEVNVNVVNNSDTPVQITNISRPGQSENLKEYFLSLDERMSTCFIEQLLAAHGTCNFIIKVHPDSQEKLISKPLVIRYIDANKKTQEQQFVLKGKLQVLLNTGLFGDEQPTITSDAVVSGTSGAQELPLITYAQAMEADKWFPYIFRPDKFAAEKQGMYPPKVLDNIPILTRTMVMHVPWTFVAQPQGPKALQKLVDLVPDRIEDSLTGKSYVKLYHGTTDDVLDIFKPGEKSIRFDVAVTRALGQGFYLTADPNEAKAYACMRLKERIKNNPNLKGMIVVMGVENKDFIEGKYSPQVHLSDDKTGEPFDNEIYFKRNSKMNNQFVFFKNTGPYLKMFEIVILPKGFGKSKSINDADGIDEANKNLAGASDFSCKI